MKVADLPLRADELQKLLDSGEVDLGVVDDDGRTPLHRAIDAGAEDAGRLLVDAGADVNRPDRWGNTPLWRAVYQVCDTAALVELLLERGADPTVKNNHDVSALDLARKMADEFDAVGGALPALEAAAESRTRSDDTDPP
jgi:ankyrin repeat protein